MPAGTRRRRGVRRRTEATTSTFATGELALPARARTSPERRHGTAADHEPSAAAVARATVTQPLRPRFCTATAVPAGATPPGRVTSPAKPALWP